MKTEHSHYNCSRRTLRCCCNIVSVITWKQQKQAFTLTWEYHGALKGLPSIWGCRHHIRPVPGENKVIVKKGFPQWV